MHQKHVLPYFIIPSTFSPQASSLPSQTDKENSTPFVPLRTSFFIPLSTRGPAYPQAQLYWAGRTWGGWPIELGNTMLVKLELWE
jgi:hypothetical protein